ncbi:MAG: hypothetical protein V1836_00945 [Candidatus Aenigmatarchaeota archaeon]
MKIQKKHAFAAAIVVGLAIIVFILLNSSSTKAGKYGDFAKCLTANGVKEYGAFWCSHCQAQKKLFGSSWKYVNYTECSLPDGSGQTEVCNKANITGYPTWEFKSGERLSGEVSLEGLAIKSGCGLG